MPLRNTGTTVYVVTAAFPNPIEGFPNQHAVDSSWNTHEAAAKRIEQLHHDNGRLWPVNSVFEVSATDVGEEVPGHTWMYGSDQQQTPYCGMCGIVRRPDLQGEPCSGRAPPFAMRATP